VNEYVACIYLEHDEYLSTRKKNEEKIHIYFVNYQLIKT